VNRRRVLRARLGGEEAEGAEEGEEGTEKPGPRTHADSESKNRRCMQAKTVDTPSRHRDTDSATLEGFSRCAVS
jgi:hypothetical protein